MFNASRGFQIASAAAALALSATAFAAEAPKGSSGKAIAASDKVHCYGVHSCARSSRTSSAPMTSTA